MYEIIAKMGPDALRKEEAMVSTKYKTVEKKVKPAAGPPRWRWVPLTKRRRSVS